MRTMQISKTPWIKEYPADWRQVPLHVLFKEHKQKNSDGSEQNLLSLSYGNIVRKDINSNEGLLPESFNGYNVIEANDIVLRLTDLQNDHRSLRTGLAMEHGIITSAYCTLRAKEEVNSSYYHYLLHAFDIMKVFYSMGEGIRQSLGYDELKYVVIPEPCVDEQDAIVSYLDAKCAAIDEAIERHKKIIEKLEDYRKSKTSQIVFRGLHQLPSRSIGIEWISEIPSHWKVMRLKYVMDNYDYQRRPVDASLRTQEGNILYDYYGASGVIDKIDGYTTEGDKILIGEDGANLVLRNLPLIYIGHGKYWVNNHAHILAPKNGNLYYFAYQMECIDYMKYITGSAQPKFSQGKMNEVPLVVPPLDEQTEIANALKEIWLRIDTSINKHKTAMLKLEEYRKSIIYNAVTGKIDCRKEAV